MTDAPNRIWVNLDDNEDGCCPTEDSLNGDGKFFCPTYATEYVRADRIEQLEAARHDADEAEAYAWQLEQHLAKAVETLRELHHAVCGKTGFAQAVRMESGKAYPWPALDKADDAVLAVLAELEGE
jgi:hypothetical protein